MILETINKGSQWNFIKEYANRYCEFIEFNILFENSDLEDFKSKFSSLLVKVDNKNKIYSPGKYLRLKYDEKMEGYLKNKDFLYFKNNFIEDPSFYIGNNEIIATITHENQVVFNSEFINVDTFKKNGFEMDTEINKYEYSSISFFNIFNSIIKKWLK